MDESKAKLFSALAKAQGAITAAGKSGENKFDHYKYATLENYWASVQKPLAENGLAFPVSVTKIEPLPDRTTGKGGIEKVIRVELTGYLCHESGESMSFICYGEGQDRSDKAIYKAVTGGKKYLLASVFNIPTTDDCEKDSDADRDGSDMDQRPLADRTPQRDRPAPRTAAPTTPAPRTAAPGPRPTRTRPALRAAAPAATIPESDSDLPWSADAPDDTSPRKAPPLPDQNRLITREEYGNISAAVKEQNIAVEKMYGYMDDTFKKRDPRLLSVAEYNKLMDVITNNPEIINEGVAF
jgi:hypothetical protein